MPEERPEISPEGERRARAYYQRIWAEGGHMGQPAAFNGYGFVMACPGRSTDVIYIYLNIEDGRILEAKWKCHACDPWMQVAGDIGCTLVKGRETHQVLNLTLEDFERMLGGPSELIADHAGAALLTIQKAVIDYEVRRTLSQKAGRFVSPKERLKEMGLAGREGQEELKVLLEERFATDQLRIPRVKLQEWVALGTVQDVSLAIQSLLETSIIAKVKANGCGFPRSFEEELERKGWGLPQAWG